MGTPSTKEVGRSEGSWLLSMERRQERVKCRKG